MRGNSAMNPYLGCGSSKRCVVLHAINDVCESVLVEHFQFFCLFCLILEKIVMVPNESKLLIAVCPSWGKKIEKKIQKKAMPLVAQYHETKA